MIAKAISFLTKKYEEYKVPFCVSIISGLCAYTYMFTNKLPNFDDVGILFSKGGTLDSGRWGLDIIKGLLPNYSMPWLWGLLSITLIAIAVCYTVKIFSIKSKIAQGLIAGIIVTFPALIDTFAYMFTSSAYAVAFLCSIVGVYFCQREKKYWIISLLLFTFSTAIYQSYVAISASYFVILLIQEVLLNQKSVITILKKAVCFFVVLVLSVAVYWSITSLLLKITGRTFGPYALKSMNNQSSILSRIKDAYWNYWAIFRFRRFGLISTFPSQIVHILSGLTIGIVLTIYYIKAIKAKEYLRIIILTVLVIMLPLSINSIYLISSAEGIHTLVLYSFVSTYIFAVVVLQEIDFDKRMIHKDVVSLSLILVIISNIYIANKSYLQLHLCYENTYSFYTSLMTEVKMTKGFDANSKVALIGNYNDYSVDNQFHNKITGICGSLIDPWSKECFISYFIGDDYCYATNEEIEQVKKTDEYKDMKIYPYYGSVKKIGNYIVVKLGTEE